MVKKYRTPEWAVGMVGVVVAILEEIADHDCRTKVLFDDNRDLFCYNDEIELDAFFKETDYEIV